MSMDSKTTSAPTSEGWDVVLAGGGLAAAVTAGELALRGQSVLLLEPSHVLGWECTRSKCPSITLRDAKGDFMDEVRRHADLLSSGMADLSNVFLLEMALEQALLHVGGRVLYGAHLLHANANPHRGTVEACVAVKAQQILLEASQGVLMSRPPVAGDERVVHSVLVVGIDNPQELQGEIEVSGVQVRFRIPPPATSSKGTLWVSWDAKSADQWAVEKILATVIPDLAAQLREKFESVSQLEIIYVGDHPLHFVGDQYSSSWTWLAAGEPRDEMTLQLPDPLVDEPLKTVDNLAGWLAAGGRILAGQLTETHVGRIWNP